MHNYLETPCLNCIYRTLTEQFYLVEVECVYQEHHYKRLDQKVPLGLDVITKTELMALLPASLPLVWHLKPG